MEEYIDKIKYLKEKIKISLKDIKNQDKNPVDNRNDFLKQLDDGEKILNEIENKAVIQIYSSQLSFLKYEDLDRITEIASEITIIDDCLLKELIKRYPWLQIRNVWTNEKLDDEFTWLDDLPKGWRKAFGLQMIEELDQILRKANYQDKYKITQIKEKWRWVKMV